MLDFREFAFVLFVPGAGIFLLLLTFIYEYTFVTLDLQCFLQKF